MAETMTQPDHLGQLPEWDLSDLYSGPNDDRLSQDLARAGDRASSFAEAWQGRLAALSGDEVARAIIEYEAIGEILGRVMSYAQLYYAAKMDDEARSHFYQAMQERVTEISTHTLFFTLELNRLEDDEVASRIAESPDLARYAPWLRDIRVYRPHQLADDVERLLLEKDVVGRSAWNRLFDETIASLKFTIQGREMGSAEALHLLSDKNRDLRREAAKEIGRVFTENARLFAMLTNTLAKDKEIEDKWRNYAAPWSSRNLSNQVEDEVVDALVSAVRAAYPRLSHRYYRLKARWLGLDKLSHWDRNAPLPQDQDRLFTWEQARDTVLGAYRAFSPDLADLGRKFFDSSWIDAPVRDGKSPGAFAHPTVPSAHPYLLVNFLGKARDVMTLAHELGHGVHQLLSARQGALMADTPLTLAETASVFGEMLTFRAMLDGETDPAKRRILLAGKVEDMLNTVVRQIAFYTFEQRVHTERRKGEMSVEKLGDLWLEVQSESLGPAFEFDEEYRLYWAYIPHFIHSPFYVYAYAFGDCLVNSLYGVYSRGEPAFQRKYLEMLQAGGTKRHKELLAPFGLDASDPAFWNEGLNVISGFIDELEAL